MTPCSLQGNPWLALSCPTDPPFPHQEFSTYKDKYGSTAGQLLTPMAALRFAMTLVMFRFARINTTTDTTCMVMARSIKCVQVDFIKESLWMTTTALVILEGVRPFVPPRQVT